MFAAEPSGRLYRSLLDCALQFCAKAILVVQADLGLDSEAEQLISDLCKLDCEVIERSEWPGTVLFNETARVYEIQYGAQAANRLAFAVDVCRYISSVNSIGASPGCTVTPLASPRHAAQPYSWMRPPRRSSRTSSPPGTTRSAAGGRGNRWSSP